MATCNMASAATGFTLGSSPSLPSTGSVRPSMVFMGNKANFSGLVVRAEGEGDSPPNVVEGDDPMLPYEAPTVGPKKGAKISHEPMSPSTNVANGTPMKMLLAQEMSRHIDSKQNSPTLLLD